MSAMLLRPFNYLAVRHPSGTLRLFNWGAPFAMAVCFAAVCMHWPEVNLLHKDGVLDKVLGFVQNMPGFYLAALAAVATFANGTLDKLMPGVPPTAKLLFNGHAEEVPLTRRRFLCMMFSYLTALSLLLTMTAIATVTFVDPVSASLPMAAKSILRLGLAGVFVMFLAQLLLITFWGLYYLGERLHIGD